MLGTSAMLRREDGFAVIRVEEAQVEMIGRAVQIRASLTNFLTVLKMPDASVKLRQTVYNFNFILGVLKGAAGMCFEDDDTWQNMMRKAQVLALATEITVEMNHMLVVSTRVPSSFVYVCTCVYVYTYTYV